jgi:hypothetical protein
MRPAQIPDELRTRPFRGSTAVRAGLLTRRQLDNAVWRSLFRDVHVHRDVPVTHELRAVAAATLLLRGAVVTGCSAAVLWGVDLAGSEDDVELTVPPSRAPVRVAGLRVRRAALPAQHLCRRRGVPATTPEATAVSVAAALVGDEAIVAVDRLVDSGIVDLEPIRALAASAQGPGSARARQACRLADGLAGSPQETRLRLLMARAGLPAPIAQFRVTDARGRIGAVDFAWPDRMLVVEYEGMWHADPAQIGSDRRRLNRLLAAGWHVVYVTAADMHRPEELVERIATALAR